jgi:O-antigen/teichoic acid export membrane protein
MFQHLFKKSDFFKNFVTLTTGSAFAQLIPFLLSPVLARLFDADEFGVLGIFVSISALVKVIATARYEMAINLPHKNADAVNLMVGSLIISVIISILTLIAVWLFNDFICNVFNSQRVSKWLYLIPLTVLFTGIIRSFSYWFNRTRRFKTLSFFKVNKSVSQTGASIGGGFAGLNAGGLIGGVVVGDLFGAAYLSTVFYRKDRKYLKLFQKQRMFKVLKRYKDFPLLNTLQAFVDKLRESGLILIISMFFTETLVGYFTFANKYTKAPLTLITYSIGQVFYQRIAQRKATNKPVFPVVKSIVLKLSIISLPFFVALFFFAEPLFAVVFTNKWIVAGTYVKILTPMLFLFFITSPVSTIPLVLEKQRAFLIITMLTNILLIAGIFMVGKMTGNIRLVVTSVSVFMSLMYAVLLLWMLRISYVSDSKIE